MKKLPMVLVLRICALLLAASPGNQATADITSYHEFARAIRANDLRALRQLASIPAGVKSENAATDLAKTSLLVERDARVNIAAKDGTTPLMVAASVPGSTETVKYQLGARGGCEGGEHILVQRSYFGISGT